jgi:hypothetical protein
MDTAITDEQIMNSILLSIKKLIGIDPSYKNFDVDIIMHINTTFTILNQLGVGPDEGFVITGEKETWDEFVPKASRVRLESIRTFIYIKVKLVFDPPQSSVAVNALEKTASECEWRLTNTKVKESSNEE